MNHFLMGSQMKLWTLCDKMGVLEATRWDLSNFTNDVLNFVKNVLNFVKDVPMVPKCIPRWGSTPNHFFMGFKMKLWTIYVQMGDSKSIGWDIPNFPRRVQGRDRP